MAHRRLLRGVTSRLAVWLGSLLLAGFLAASLARMAPGFGIDERAFDARLSAETQQALVAETAEQRNVLRYYPAYLKRLASGDLGVSVSLGRPVRELLAERLPVTVRSTAAGLSLAWLLGLAAIAALEFYPRPLAEASASGAAGLLLSVPAAVVALGCVYAGAGPAVAIALILLPRVFRYARNVAAAARRAPHVVAAHAMGVSRARILALHVALPVLPDLAALAGVSVSMAIGAAIPVEALTSSPGVGHLIWQAALSRDVPVLVNVTLLIAAATSAANLAADAASHA